MTEHNTYCIGSISVSVETSFGKHINLSQSVGWEESVPPGPLETSPAPVGNITAPRWWQSAFDLC